MGMLCVSIKKAIGVGVGLAFVIKNFFKSFIKSSDRRGTTDVPMREILGLLGWEPRKSTSFERIVLISAISATLLVVPLFFIMRFAGQSSENSIWVSISFFFVIGTVLFVLLRQSWPGGAGGFAALSAFLETTKAPSAITDTRGKLVGSNKLYRRMFLGGVFPPNVLMDRDRIGNKGFENLKARISQGKEGRAFISFSQSKFKGLIIPQGSGNYELIAKPYGNYVVWMFERFDPNLQVVEASSWFDQLMKPFFDKAEIAIMFFNHEGGLSYFNPAAIKVLGLNKKSVEKLTKEAVLKDDGVISHASAQGRIRLEITEIPLPGMSENSQSPGGCAILLREKEVETRVGQSQVTHQDLARIYEGSPIAIVSVGEDGQVLEFNRSFANLYISRLGKKLLLGANFTGFVHPDQRDKVLHVIKDCIKGRSTPLPIEFGAYGSENFVYQTFFGSGSSYGERSAILYMIDTSDQKRLELQFAQGQKMQAVGQLAGGVAHDFNNLLTAIIGFCDLLLLRHKAGDQSFADIMQIKQNANRGANLVRQLLAFSRRQTLQPKILNVTDVIAELASLIRRLVGENIDFEIIHGRNLGRIKVDQGQLEQVIINLVVNARDAILENEETSGFIKIKTRNIMKNQCEALGFEVMKPDEYVEIIVEDNGSGIPKSFQDKVFEPFFTTKQVGKGTGLGLATVYGIVKQTGGYIFVDDKRKLGTALRVYLPFYKKENSAIDTSHIELEDKQIERRDLTGSATILVVEDEDGVRLFTVRALTNKGYNVLEADCGESALDIINGLGEGERIDLMVSDVVMPGMDGPTLALKAKELQPKMRIILTSGYAEEAFSKKQDNIKYEFLPKPYNLDDLASRVKSVLTDSRTS